MRHYCTLFDRNYLERGLVLYQSLKRHSSEPFLLTVLALDNECQSILEELCLPGLEIVALRYVESCFGLAEIKKSRTHQEYCWTLASQLMHFLFLAPRNQETDVLTYLDADLMFFSDPKAIFDEIGEHSIGIIPHRFAERDRRRLEPNGKYNVSWVTIRDSATGRACIERWSHQCREWCYYRNEAGKFGDQKYLDEWPLQHGSEVRIIQNSGAGLAPWNLGQYRGEPIIFYHFHEFKERSDGTFQLTRWPVRQCDRELIYEPYIRAYRETKQMISRVDQTVR